MNTLTVVWPCNEWMPNRHIVSEKTQLELCPCLCLSDRVCPSSGHLCACALCLVPQRLSRVGREDEPMRAFALC